MAEQEAVNTKSKPNTFIITMIAAVIILVLVAIIVMLLKRPATVVERDPYSTAARSARATVVTKDNVDDVLAKASEPIEDTYYTCTMNSEWHFTSSKSSSYDAYVMNSTDNRRTVYFDLFIDGVEGEELVYSSPYIPVGSELTDIKLTETLEKGTYSATMVYHLVDDDKAEITTLSVGVTLYIEN